uniref:CYTH domain-containing protein n=1 Tax=Hydatigena taeniaeformis TaxID=6205 RepID=A0A0R3WWQ6_HYDTA
LEHSPKSFQLSLRGEDFILSTSNFSSMQQKSSRWRADEDQLLIVEYSKHPRASRILANGVWCFRRLVVRNLSLYPVSVQVEAVGEEFHFKEDIPMEARDRTHIIETLESLQVTGPLHSKKCLKVAANDVQSVRYDFKSHFCMKRYLWM